MSSNKDNNLNYDEILNYWHDKIIDKADKVMEKANSYEVGSTNYSKYKFYAEGIYQFNSKNTPIFYKWAMNCY